MRTALGTVLDKPAGHQPPLAIQQQKQRGMVHNVLGVAWVIDPLVIQPKLLAHNAVRACRRTAKALELHRIGCKKPEVAAHRLWPVPLWVNADKNRLHPRSLCGIEDL